MVGCFYPLLAMTTKRQLGWRKLFLILTVLPCCSSLDVSIPEKQYTVVNGDDITMTCSFVPAQPDFTTLVLTWEVFPDNPGAPLKTVANYITNNLVDISAAYEGRVFMDVDLINRVSTLRLTKATIQDSRNYQCGAIIPGDDGGTHSATTFLLVLVPPSPPICRIKGKAEYGHNISLTCMSEEGSPEPAYAWTTYSVENIPRQFPLKTTQKDGVLSLFNISRETSGFFICTSANEVATASCNFTLAVMPGSMNEGSIAVAVGGVVAAFLVLGILMYCCCCKKGKKDKYADGAPDEIKFYKDGPEAEEVYWDVKSNSETKQHEPHEDKDVVPQNSYGVGTFGYKLEGDQHSYTYGKERDEGKGSVTGSQRDRDDQPDQYRGSRDRLDDRRDRYGGSRDCLDDQRDRYGGSRDRLDDQRDRYGGSRDRLEDQRDRYGGSRDRLDDQRDRYGGSRDHLEDQRDRYGGSRDRLDDRRDRYGGSRDRLEDQRDRYGGSRDRLEDQRDRYGGSRDRLEDQRDRYGGSRDRLDDQRDRYGGSRDRLDDRRDRYGGSRDRLDYSDDQCRN